MRVEWEIGLYAIDFEKILKWYNLAFKDKHPSKDDEKLFHKMEWIADDLRIQEREEKEADSFG